MRGQQVECLLNRFALSHVVLLIFHFGGGVTALNKIILSLEATPYPEALPSTSCLFNHPVPACSSELPFLQFPG